MSSDFAFNYQPVFDRDNNVAFLEALIRPVNSSGNPVPIADFIASKKDKTSFDFSVVKQVIKETLDTKFAVSVNLHASSIESDEFISMFLDLYENINKQIIFEITELEEPRDIDKFIININILRMHGVLLALDDFGVGYANDKFLEMVEFDIVKLDGLFIKHMATDYLKTNLLLSVLEKIRCCYSCHVVIEKIEDVLTNKMLKFIEKDLGMSLLRQGFFLSHPRKLPEVYGLVSNSILKPKRKCNDIAEQGRYFKILMAAAEELQGDKKNEVTNSILKKIRDVFYLPCGNDYYHRRISKYIKAFDSGDLVDVEKKITLRKILNLLIFAEAEHGNSSICKNNTLLSECIGEGEFMFCIRDVDGEHVYTNKKYDDFFGMNMVGENLYKLMDSSSENIKALLSRCLELDKKCLISGDKSINIESFCTSDGVSYYETSRESINFGCEKFVMLYARKSDDFCYDIHGCLTNIKNVDSLTGAFNRHYLNSFNYTDFNFCACIDLDGFKALNDAKGHAEGDLILREFSNICARNIREEDRLIRLGGDEFLILSNILDLDLFRDRILSIRNYFEQACSGLSFSFGVSLISASLEASMKEADILMYMQKNEKKLFVKQL